MNCKRGCTKVCVKCYTEEDLADAFNVGYKKGYCVGLANGREEGYCIGHKKGVIEGCEDTKQQALDCIKCIECR